MTVPDPHSPGDEEVAEYVLGTLPLGERRALEAAMRTDPALAEAVRVWEARLAPLAASEAEMRPSPLVWDRIASALPTGAAAAPSVAPEILRLRRSRNGWRGAAAAAGAMAAALALFLASERLVPRPPPSGLVAVVNRDGALPALIVRVDPRAGTVQVRSLAAERPAGRSLELWSIAGSGPPRSLGVIGAQDVSQAALPSGRLGPLEGATLAVSVEPPGGSPTGGPTGPVIYQGRLVPESP